LAACRISQGWGCQMRSVADDAVAAIIEKWSAAFNRLDAEALAQLYSNNAFFFGSKASLYRGKEGGGCLFQRAAALAFADG
jgi:ketosteroid isomerase-like protein